VNCNLSFICTGVWPEKGSTLDLGCQSPCQKDHNWTRNRLGWNVLDCSLLFKEHCRTDEMSSILVSSQSLAEDEKENDLAEVEKWQSWFLTWMSKKKKKVQEELASSRFDPMVKKKRILRKNISTPGFLT